MNHNFVAAIRRVALGAVLVALPLGAQQTTIPKVQLRSTSGTDSLRSFFDSLAARRTSGAPAPLMLAPDTSKTVAWLDLLQDPALLTLVREAVQRSPDMALAQARIREYRAMVGIARSGRLPDVDVNASAGTQQVVFGALGASSFDAYRATVDLSWEVDFWGKNKKIVAGARADLSGQDEAQRATLLSLVANVAQGYLELSEIDAKIAIAQRTLTSRQSTLRLAERRLAEGVISELDVRLFEAEVAGPAAQVASLTQARAVKEHELNTLLGRNEGTIARGRPLLEVVRSIAVPDSVSSLLVARRPDVLRAETEITTADLRTDLIHAQSLPKFMITGSYGTQADRPGSLFGSNSEVYSINAGVQLSLTGRERSRTETEAASARAEQARIRYQQTVNNAMREVSDALVGVRASRDRVVALEVQTRAFQRAQQLAEERYAAGIASYLEVLDAQRGLFAAEMAQIEAGRDYLASGVTLYRALGGSWDNK